MTPRNPPGPRTVLAVAALLAAAAVPAAWPPAPPAAAQVPVTRRGVIAVWEPRYTGAPALAADDDVLTLAAAEGGARLWLAGRSWVTALTDGVWAPYEHPPGAQMIFALAPDGADLWAFGLDGGAWRRQAGQWTRLDTPAVADLYAAAARGPGDVWAGGFDYAANQGVLFHAHVVDGRPRVDAAAGDLLKYRSLYALAADPSGTLWAGGCDYAAQPGQKTPILLRLPPGGAWAVESVPVVDGCIHGLSFDADGFGLAAAGSDLLWHPAPVLTAAGGGDGAAGLAAAGAWQAYGQPPPEDRRWVRVAAVAPRAGAATGDPEARGWAVAGVPEWNGYRDGQAPWRLDANGWAPAVVEPAAGTVGEDATQSVAAVAGDGRSAWALGDLRSAAVAEGQARVLGLGDDGRVRLDHPWLPAGGRIRDGDIAVGPSGTVWVGASLGADPFMRHDGRAWAPAAGRVAGADARVAVSRVDMAPDGTGWATGSTRPRDGSAGARRAMWRYDGQAWASVDPPAARAVQQLRALPGGRAWAVVARGADGRGQLAAFDGGAWSMVAGAPPVLVPAPTAEPGAVANHIAVRAPFDALAANGSLAGWLGGADGQRYRVAGGAFTPVPADPAGVVADLRLTGPRTGWAIASDPARPAQPGGLPSGILLRLQDTGWREVPPRMPGATRPAPRATATPAAGGLDLQWHLMAPAGPDEVWLYGSLHAEQAPARQPARVLAGFSRARGEWVYLGCSGVVQAMAAVPVADAGGGAAGVDVWLLADGPCGTPADPRLAARRADGSANPDHVAAFTGPVSRVRVRRVVDVAFLPAVGRW